MLRAGGTVVRALSSLLYAETSAMCHVDHNQEAMRLDLRLGVAAVRQEMKRAPILFRNIYMYKRFAPYGATLK